jgi:hypothetical protein
MIKELTEEEFDNLLQRELEEKYHKARAALIAEGRDYAFSVSLGVAIREAKRNAKWCMASAWSLSW